MIAVAGNTFDAWLERELKQAASAQAGPHPLPSQARYQAVSLQPISRLNPVLALRSLASTRAAAAAFVAVVAVVAAGAAAEAAITGSADPSNWGHQLVRQVQHCKAALTPGSHGIGECVSTFARQHGKPQRGADTDNNDPKPASARPSNQPSDLDDAAVVKSNSGNQGAAKSNNGSQGAANSNNGSQGAANSNNGSQGAGNSNKGKAHKPHKPPHPHKP
jgi:hypothetical protein